LGLLTADESDEADIITGLTNVMQNQSMDFHRTFRALCSFSPAAFLRRVLKTEEKEAWVQHVSSSSAASPNLNGDTWEKGREIFMRGVNPRFVLRQWVLEEVIKKCEQDPYKGKRILAKVMEVGIFPSIGVSVLNHICQMSTRPFESWGAEFEEDDASVVDAEVKEERRFCGVGSREMLGFQCSCSS
jgi:uncharacterized protein YdiU (UPF0061 family)